MNDEHKDAQLRSLFESWNLIHLELLDIWETFPDPYSEQQQHRIEELTKQISEIDAEIEELNTPPADMSAGWEL